MIEKHSSACAQFESPLSMASSSISVFAWKKLPTSSDAFHTTLRFVQGTEKLLHKIGVREFVTCVLYIFISSLYSTARIEVVLIQNTCTVLLLRIETTAD